MAKWYCRKYLKVLSPEDLRLHKCLTRRKGKGWIYSALVRLE